jgi:hypothetical protein
VDRGRRPQRCCASAEETAEQVPEGQNRPCAGGRVDICTSGRVGDCKERMELYILLSRLAGEHESPPIPWPFRSSEPRGLATRILTSSLARTLSIAVSVPLGEPVDSRRSLVLLSCPFIQVDDTRRALKLRHSELRCSTCQETRGGVSEGVHACECAFGCIRMHTHPPTHTRARAHTHTHTHTHATDQLFSST